MYKMKMTVRAMRAEGEIVCKDDVEVVWGIKGNTIAFVAEGREIQFHGITKKPWATAEGILFYEYLIRSYQGPGIYVNVVADDYGNEYLLKIVSKDGKVAIFISNLYAGLPNYQFGFGCNKCSDHKLASVR
jgi:hypothetical protein